MMYERLNRGAALFFIISMLIACGGCSVMANDVMAPVIVGLEPAPGADIISLPDGSLKAFYVAEEKHVYSIRSTDEGLTWGQPLAEFELSGEPHAVFMMLDHDAELHTFALIWRGKGRQLLVDRFLDIWHCKSSGKGANWSKPKCIFEGYVGAILCSGIQLSSGRIVLPHQYWVPGSKCGPPTGCHVVTTSYTNDGGNTWKLSPAKLAVPCFADYTGSNYGACEPTMIKLKDKRLWMLMRTQTGFLYESFSSDGVEWSEAVSSRFHSSSSPAALKRLPDGRIVLFWNNCEDPPLADSKHVYVGRDALHAAISEDDGKTWRGYREVYRDPKRNEPPPRRGDRGTAYPFVNITKDGKIILLTGQGEGRRVLLHIEPQWLCETHHEDDFSKGLEGWCVFKTFGPSIRGHWRNRTQGPRLIEHPTKSHVKVLHVCRPDEKAGDGAVWNFPVGTKGTLRLRLMLQKGFGGANVALADRLFFPTDDKGEKEAIFSLPISKDGSVNKKMKLETSRWYMLQLEWDMTNQQCRVLVDGRQVTQLSQLNKSNSGVSYLRLRSTAEDTDKAGFLVESVKVDVIGNAQCLE